MHGPHWKNHHIKKCYIYEQSFPFKSKISNGNSHVYVLQQSSSTQALIPIIPSKSRNTPINIQHILHLSPSTNNGPTNPDDNLPVTTTPNTS